MTSRPIEGGAGRGRERGHLLILLMVGVTVMLIMMTVAAQSWTFQMRREMELELIFRGEQYIKGIEAFRKANGNAFPVGDLKILAKKNVSGARYMRKLYKNPFDPNGQWQYLYLHPGGTGFINPCAVGAGPGFNDPRGGRGGLMRGQNGGASTGFGNPFDRNITGQRSADDDDDGGVPDAKSSSQLSALDPKTFKSTGIQKMNLPIVGVVNCKMVESIREYKGQTWLSNWAFTPLAQGEFGAVAQAGGSAGVARNFTGGVGLSGSEAFMRGSRNPTPPTFTNDNPWSRDGKFHDQPPPDGGGDQGYDPGGGFDAYGNPVNADPNRPNAPSGGRGPAPPNPANLTPPHANPPGQTPPTPPGQTPPNPPGGNPPPQPTDPNGTVHDPNQPSDGSEDEDDEGDTGDDEEDEEDPNTPPPDPNHPSAPGPQQAIQPSV